MISVIDYLRSLKDDDIKNRTKHFEHTLIATDSLVLHILNENKTISLSRLSTLNCEHYFSLMRSKDYHLNVYRYFQHSAHLRQIFMIVHQENSDVPLPEKKDTKYYDVSNSVRFKVKEVNKILKENYDSKNEKKEIEIDNNENIENIKAKDKLIIIKKNTKKQTVREGTTKEQFDSRTNLEHEKWINYVDVLLEMYLGQRTDCICLIKGCKKTLKNNNNFIRHLTRVHSLGTISHFVFRMFLILTEKGLQEKFDNDNNLEDKLISVLENLTNNMDTSDDTQESQINQNNEISENINLSENISPSQINISQNTPLSQNITRSLGIDSRLNFMSKSLNLPIPLIPIINPVNTSLYDPKKKAFLLSKEKMKNTQVVILDLEINPNKKCKDISEIYAISVVGEIKEFHSLIYCENYSDRQGKYINKITSNENMNAEKKNKVRERFVLFLDMISKGFDKVILVAHNGKSVDFKHIYKFLNDDKDKNNFTFEDKRKINFDEFDSMDLVVHFTGLRKSVPKLCNFFDIQYNEQDLHRAIVDVYYLLQIITKTIEYSVVDTQTSNTVSHYLEKYFLEEPVIIKRGFIVEKCFDEEILDGNWSENFEVAQFNLWDLPTDVTEDSLKSWKNLYNDLKLGTPPKTKRKFKDYEKKDIIRVMVRKYNSDLKNTTNPDLKTLYPNNFFKKNK